MADEKVVKIPKVAAGEFDVLYINRCGRDTYAEVIARGISGGFNIAADCATAPEMVDLVVDLKHPHVRGNAVRLRIPDQKMLVGWGGEAGISFRFRVLD